MRRVRHVRFQGAVISIHASRMGCDKYARSRCWCCANFNPRIPYGMRLPARPHPRGVAQDFNPRIPYGMRLIPAIRSSCFVTFQSTHPVWDATTGRAYKTTRQHYFNPRIPYGMRRSARSRCWCCVNFNPRIPYGMRRDRQGRFRGDLGISIHASRMGCDLMIAYHAFRQSFQSTHPVWDATHAASSEKHGVQISIHASRMGCDMCFRVGLHHPADFNPRIPYGMRPDQARLDSSARISIHASRMGCDRLGVERGTAYLHFNPRIPYGMRRQGR